MAEYINRQDAINAVEQLYRYESDRMTALQEIPSIQIKEEYMWREANFLSERYAYSGPYETMDEVISEAVKYFKYIYSNGTQRACSEKPEISVRKLVNGEVLSEEKINLSKYIADMIK